MATYEQFVLNRENLIKSWPLSSSIVPVVLISIIYLLISLKLGPSFMSNKSAFELKEILMIYNAFQVGFNLWLCLKINIIKTLPYLLTSCQNNTDSDFENYLTELSWWFLINKIVDLLDTIFMILRKKTNQINLLHLYHHPSTLIVAWLHMKYGPGVHHIVSWFMNAVVHTIMYFYYFMAGLGPKYQKYLWWKKYLTSLQMVQFCLLLVYLGKMYVTCSNISMKVVIICASNPTILLIMFIKFYLKTYTSKTNVK